MQQPILFQISPASYEEKPDEDEEFDRSGELLNAQLQNLIAASGCYNGGGEKSLENDLESFLSSNSNYPGDRVIVVNVHGDEWTGYFTDPWRGKDFIWTPQELWRVLSPILAKQTHNIYLVQAQCYGKQFADNLRPLATQQNIKVIGLSPNTTKSTDNDINSETKVDNIAVHEDLLKWMTEKYSNAESSPIKACHGNNHKAVKVLTANRMYNRKWCANCDRWITDHQWHLFAH